MHVNFDDPYIWSSLPKYVGKESTCNAGDPDSVPLSGRSPGEGTGYPFQCPWVGKIPWRRKRLPTPVFRPREFHGLYSARGHKESDMSKKSDTVVQLSLSVLSLKLLIFVPLCHFYCNWQIPTRFIIKKWRWLILSQKNMSFKARTLDFKSWMCNLITVQMWASILFTEVLVPCP